MAPPIATQKAVTEIANALLTEGLEPSIIAVQSRIGGGSYSTVKRYLDAWKQERTQLHAAATDTPPAIQAKGQEFAHSVWVLACAQAQREAQAVKDEARAEVAAVRADLAGATSEIARLENVESAQAEELDAQQSKMRQVELALVEAQAQARRVPELEQSLVQLRTELDAARKEASDKAVEAGRLAGEADALRTQMREWMATISPPK